MVKQELNGESIKDSDINQNCEKSMFKCENCNYGFFEKSEFDRHVETTHDGWYILKCNDCDAVLRSKVDLSLARFGLKRHIDSVHEGKRPYECVT